MKRHAYALTVGVAALLLGLFLASKPAFEFNEKITAGDLLNAAVTVGLAAAIGALFQQSFSEARAEKDLLMRQAAGLCDGLRGCRRLFYQALSEGVSVELDREMIAALRLVSVEMSTLERMCSMTRVDYMDGSLTNARTQLREYRRLLTERALSPSNSYPPDVPGRADATFGKINDALQLFSLRVNRR